MELEAVRKDGSRFPVETCGRLVPYEGRTVVMSAGRDITARKQAEIELRGREEVFRAVAEAAFDAIVVHDEGKVLEANRACAVLHGYADPEELRGMDLSQLLTAESLQKAAAAAASGNFGPHELVGLRRDGTRFDLETCGRLAHHRGRPAAVTAGRDITARKRAEAELRQLAEERQRLTAQVISAQEEERRSISRELHDGLGQILAALKMEADWLAQHADHPDEVTSTAGRVREKADEMLSLVRGMARQLRPPILDDLGVDCALDSLVAGIRDRSAIECHTAFDAPRRLDAAVGTAIYRIAQEALSNMLRHGQAENCWLSFEDTGANAILRVEHDGREVDGAVLVRGRTLGVVGMRERAVGLGGEFSLEPRDGGGTILLARIPLPGAAPADDRG
jgi:hypothetical protein